MLKYDAEKVKEILIHEGYSERMAQSDAETLVNLHEDLQPALDQWLKDRTISEEITMEGVTLKMIMEKRRTNFIGALASMSYFIKNPGSARRFKNRPIIVRRLFRKPKGGGEL
ncbi:hypothetical protein GXN76_02120 [Kroppenstedtia pulmonis]|uniref:Uncharacterized protein n=1 Tax=Kroppenstedtia pulmonis TaxID=1380685 RepID=A0A7D3XH78_9BACL|nr:hypothetical protein [Kroppenstedtia pulmonis]QKG83384.1 hypothetical protein GXN76_02120 [Kroppenstedtia pulmonis]